MKLLTGSTGVSLRQHVYCALSLLEVDLWRCFGALRRFEILLGGESGNAREEVLRELLDERIVLAHRVIVAAPLRGDTVLRPRQLIRQPGKLGVGFQLWVIFSDGEQRDRAPLSSSAASILSEREPAPINRERASATRVKSFSCDA